MSAENSRGSQPRKNLLKGSVLDSLRENSTGMENKTSHTNTWIMVLFLLSLYPHPDDILNFLLGNIPKVT